MPWEREEGLKVFIIDLGSQWGHRIWRTLRDLNCDVKMIKPSAPLGEVKKADALVFSGGALRVGLGELAPAGKCRNYLNEFEGGIMGICAGMQLIALYSGGEVKPARKPEYGFVELVVDDANDLFAGLPKRFAVWASHNDEVARLPRGFRVLAHSRDCRIQAFKHASRAVYGVLFHPEVEHSQYSEQIYSNFLKACRS